MIKLKTKQQIEERINAYQIDLETLENRDLKGCDGFTVDDVVGQIRRIRVMINTMKWVVEGDGE